MPLKIIKSELTSVETEAIVYAYTQQPIILFNFNPMIYKKSGQELIASREAVGTITPGEAKLDPTPRLQSQHIIHTSAPIWHGGLYQEEQLLQACYEKVFHLVAEHQYHSVALPIIATDHLGYPKKLTQQMAFSCIRTFLAEHPDINVFLVVPNLAGIMLPGNRYSAVKNHLKNQENKKEQILAYCQSQNIQDIYEINQILFRFGEEQLEF